MAFHPQPPQEGEEDTNIDVHTSRGTPIRYVPLDHLYSATSPCRVNPSGSANVMSKKVKARKLNLCHLEEDGDQKKAPEKPPLVHVYSRRRKRLRHCSQSLSFYDSLVGRVESTSENCEIDEYDKDRENDNFEEVGVLVKKRKGDDDDAELRKDCSPLGSLDRPRLRNGRNFSVFNSRNSRIKQHTSSENCLKMLPASHSVKRWVRLIIVNVDPKTFVGLQCQVYWPLDLDWYTGSIEGYDSETKLHHVKYKDGDEEDLNISSEKIKFHVSREDMQHLNLRYGPKGSESDVSDYNEMLVLAASLDDDQEIEPGDLIWAKLTGHAMWPAVVLDESFCQGLKSFPGGSLVPVQFFGSHDFARVKMRHAVPFVKGLLASFHLKCKKPRFIDSLEEAKKYLNDWKLPSDMLRVRKGFKAGDCKNASEDDDRYSDSSEDCLDGKGTEAALRNMETSPYIIGDLKILNLGKIVEDSRYFRDDRYVWPEGYTAVRKFTSITDPKVCSLYKMEVLRDAESKIRPLFRVISLDNGDQFSGSTPSACWNKIYKRIKRIEKDVSDGSVTGGVERVYKSGSEMFGFSNPVVDKLIRGLPNFFKLGSGYRRVRIDWYDLDKCNVCHMDEEYENNLFLQCDKCRIMVHAKCYGEQKPVNGVLWLCNLCRPSAPEPNTPCCLCPLLGGAMKPTTDGQWAHLACAMWIPETCLADVKKMEPIDGLDRINKDRWKLLCSICRVKYGACIQCSNNSCRVAYHPLCARAAGLCVELEDEDRLYVLSLDEDEDQCVRLLSFCWRHRQPNGHSVGDERIKRVGGHCSDHKPPSNPSGCARSEPYNYFGRRGRKEPEALAAASLKRLFVENQPYLVGGYCQHGLLNNLEPSGRGVCPKFFCSQNRLRGSLADASNSVLSTAEKYKYMKETFRKCLAFGKSRIHGFGIFAKHPFKGGDMVIEYTGELVRPPIADRREHFIYNSLVGAGTYMFRIDDERVIDATRAGSIAHLINHSCEPNCYSRVISVNGDEHIIIFARRDIKQWEELTYDYRFFSIDEQLACYCGFPRCRGIVNDTEAEDRASKLYVPRSELIDWRGE
ncbi:hypothetical protein L6164_013511 [Bauhinia variegata]|uniref:Uncharacterized protein n=1 Tax=Bauhinia variegata TaxID=167791 RepID=A0ACB9NFU2_BAUVA|nr:hypothetical protein L6164_013511 [Bauhinia variegata]